MSRTDKDKPWWVQAAQAPVGERVAEHSLRCEATWPRDPYVVRLRERLGTLPCMINDIEWGLRRACQWTLPHFETYSYWAHTRTSTRRLEYVSFTRRERARVRDNLTDLVMSYNTHGHVDDWDIPDVDTTRGPGGCYCC